MSKKLLLATNGSGYQLHKCLQFDFFKDSVMAVMSDKECPGLDVARRHGVAAINLNEPDSAKLNVAMLAAAADIQADYILSTWFTRIFRGEILQRYANRIFNCHPSILPSFKGYYDTRDTRRTHHARKIYERTLESGALVTGCTIHAINAQVDDGYPVIVSSMNIPYGETPEYTRHRLFIQEVKTLLQFTHWLNEDRLSHNADGRPIIKGATFDTPHFSPNIDNPQIARYDLPYPYQLDN